jgi:hypothetical protein
MVDAEPRRSISKTAREILAAFLLTFIAARVLVYLIMARRMPDLFLHVGGTHVHHLNYGIVLLAVVGAVLLLFRPTGLTLTLVTLLYGVGLGLTFDEFGMWLHLGGGYWQRASFDAVIVIAGLFGLIAAAPALPRFRQVHWITAVFLIVGLLALALAMIDSYKYAAAHWSERFKSLEEAGPR